MSAFARIRWIKEGVKRRYNTPMESTIRFVEQHWDALLLPLSVMAVTLLIGLVVRNVVFRTLRRWAAGTKSKLDDIVVEALRSPFMIWVLMLALHFGAQTRVGSGDEGYITDMSSRSTSIRSLPSNGVIIPNAKLAKTTITNYNLPEQSMAVSVAVSVSYDCDPQAVENVLLGEARKAAEQVPGLLSAPAPIVRFMPGFGPSSLDLTLICHVRKFADQYLVQHELRKRIVRRFREAQIEIPFPTRTIYMHDEYSKT